MGGLPSSGEQRFSRGIGGESVAFSAKELYNLKQVYHYLCLHTTTLTACQLDHSQFHSFFGAQKQFKGLWRPLFNAIDTKHDGIIDFEEFLTFVTSLKRGDTARRRLLCFKVFDADNDGYALREDVRRIAETSDSCCRKRWIAAAGMGSESNWEEECTQFLTLADEDNDGRFLFEEFDTYCSVYGEAVVNQTLEVLDNMFDTAIEETGITITATDVRNSKPHIDWRDHGIKMGSLFCCSSQPPVFTKAPTT